jgi:hypothetical protein
MIKTWGGGASRWRSIPGDRGSSNPGEKKPAYRSAAHDSKYPESLILLPIQTRIFSQIYRRKKKTARMRQEEASACRKLRIPRNSKHESATDPLQRETLHGKLGFEAQRHWTHFEMPHMSTRSQKWCPIHTTTPLQVLASVAFILCIATCGPGKNLLISFGSGTQQNSGSGPGSFSTRPFMCRVNQGKWFTRTTLHYTWPHLVGS